MMSITDYNYGMEREIIIIERLKTIFNDDTLTKTKYKYQFLDLYSKKNTFLYELKSNRIPLFFLKNRGVFINKDKLNYDNLVIVYEFYDDKKGENKKLYYIQYEEKLFNTFETGIMDNKKRNKKYEGVYIPIKYLTEINEDKVIVLEEKINKKIIEENKNFIKKDDEGRSYLVKYDYI
jgi:hypothetical protein